MCKHGKHRINNIEVHFILLLMDEKYYIFPYNWWNGFNDRTDGNHIGFYEKLFQYTLITNFEIVYDINKANILLEAGHPNENIHNSKKWAYKINFIGEPCLPMNQWYNVVLTSVNNIENIVDLPLSIAYIHCNNFFPLLLNPPRVINVPKKFCTFIVSNPKCIMRNKIFEKLNNYKKVDSMGGYLNNCNYQLPYNYWTNEYFNVLSEYKFMICCENTKMETYSTEKIVNPYLARTIPIYWGTHNIKNIFNIDSILFLEDETDESFEQLIQKVIELDNDDEKYIEYINRPIFNEHNIDYWNKNYTLESLGKKFDKIIQK